MSSHVIVEQALNKALSSVKCNSEPVCYHNDLYSQNVFAKELNYKLRLGNIIDSGKSMFAPIHLVHYQTRTFIDFEIQNMNVCDMYCVDKNELIPYDILRLDPILLLNHIKYSYEKIDYVSQTDLYVNKCASYLHKE